LSVKSLVIKERIIKESHITNKQFFLWLLDLQ